MQQPHKVVLYGNSMFLAGAQASLSSEQGFQFISLDVACENAAERLIQLAPQVLIFDMATTNSESVLPFLSHCPTLRLVGLDTTRNIVTLYSSEQFIELTFGDLAQIIKHSTGGMQ